MKKFLIITSLTIVASLTLAACSQTDVVGKESVNSFKEVLNAIPKNITADDMNGGWSLDAPDKSARFIWSKNFSKSPTHDVMIEFDAQPFLNAGLDVNKLPAGLYYDGKIMVGTKLGNENLTYTSEATPLASYEQIVNLKRDKIKYHTELDHYGVDLANGNAFEWAKDMSKNDKDIVFILDPKVFIDAGVNPAKVQGWAFAKVKIADASGKPSEVDKFLKSFNLK